MTRSRCGLWWMEGDTSVHTRGGWASPDRCAFQDRVDLAVHRLPPKLPLNLIRIRDQDSGVSRPARDNASANIAPCNASSGAENFEHRTAAAGPQIVSVAPSFQRVESEYVCICEIMMCM